MPTKKNIKDPAGDEFIRQFVAFQQHLLHSIYQSFSRVDFIENFSRRFLETMRLDEIEVRVRELTKYLRCRARRNRRKFNVDMLPYSGDDPSRRIPAGAGDSPLEIICRAVFTDDHPAGHPHFTDRGGFRTNDASTPVPWPLNNQDAVLDFSTNGPHRSLAVLRLALENRVLGVVVLKSRRKNAFTPEILRFSEAIADLLGNALAHQRAMAALRERVKELSCLYDIAKVLKIPGTPIHEVLGEIVNFIAPAWRYPDIASARIELDGVEYLSAGFRDGVSSIRAPIVGAGGKRGSVEVTYSEKRPDRDEGPFLEEERKLIDTVAQNVAMIVGDKEAEDERSLLQEQLQHADRLTTIGRLAGGIAHEINEPLAGVLGFAQLVLKDPTLSEQSRTDLKRIQSAALHGREIVKKLLFFGRQSPPRKTRVDLNEVVREVLSMLDGHLRKGAVETLLRLESPPPVVIADPSQMTQVLVNLIVNAIHAMPDGGLLTVATGCASGEATISVEDTGTGMSEEAKRKAFTPFFTTKDIHQGTGLGLSVVHGIVKSHGGRIDLESREGVGTKFVIYIPCRLGGS